MFLSEHFIIPFVILSKRGVFLVFNWYTLVLVQLSFVLTDSRIFRYYKCINFLDFAVISSHIFVSSFLHVAFYLR